MTATALPRTGVETAFDRLREVNRQLAQIDDAYASGVHGWAEALQDSRRALLVEKADLLGRLGFANERRELLSTIALEA